WRHGRRDRRRSARRLDGRRRRARVSTTMRWLIVGFFVLWAGLAHADISIHSVTIRNASNSEVGSVDSDGTIRNSSNSSVGKIEKDGTIRNASNSSVGKVESDGTIRNGSNSSI